MPVIKKRFIVIEKKAIFCEVRKGGAQALVTNTWTRITFNSMPFFNAITYDFINNQYQILEQGRYVVAAAVSFVVNPSATGRGVRIMRNGNEEAREYVSGGLTQQVAVAISKPVYCNAGDILHCEGIQVSGAGLNVSPIGTAIPYFSVDYLSNLV